MLENSQENIIDLLKKDLKIIQRADYFSFSIDSLLISEFVKITKNTNVIVDLGTGNGAIPLFISKKTNKKIIGFEIQKTSYELALRNIKMNNLEHQIEIIHEDMKNWELFLEKGSIDIVVSNPPFFEFKGDISLLNNLEQISIARHEIDIKLDEIIEISSNLLKYKGYFYLVHRVDRMIEIFSLMKKNNIEPKRIRICHPKEKNEGKILLIEGIKNGNPSLRILPPLYLNKENGDYSDEVLEMFY